MLSTSPLTEPDAGHTEPHGVLSEMRYDLSEELPVAAQSAALDKGEFVMGPRQMASLAFVAVLLIGIMSAIAYFAGRKNSEAPKVIERVVERVVTAPTATAAAKPAEPARQAAPRPAPVAKQANAEVTAPVLNQVYLQAGSVDVGVAQVIVEGLRQRGVPCIVGIGINNKVARILVGPFTSPEEQRVAQKKIEDLGFHPYPRAFTLKDLEQQEITPLNR